MDSHGVSDVPGDSPDAEPCPTCGSDARVASGACLSCLLRGALNPAAGPDQADTRVDEIDDGDPDWRLGNYQILEEIGRGGMGVIYRARQRHSNRIVALKCLQSYHGDSDETLERFRREAQAAASLDHPNILPIYEVGEANGLPFFTMKFASGGSLYKAAPALRCDPRECVRLIAKVARAVAYAHREGILHRDLKAGNILLDARGEPMVSDFGLAKWVDANSDLTRSLAIFGTPGFIAPEQAEGDRAKLTPAADVYSLGAILFDLLTGRPPFLAEHALAVIRQASEKPAPKLRSVAPDADRDLETICAKCLERDPTARYRAASDLAEDLERWLEGRTILARPISPPRQLWRWSKRNRLLSGSIAASVILACAGLGWVVQNRHLAAQVREKELARRSMVVVPFLDLDTGEPDHLLSRAAATALGEQASLSGVSDIHSVDVPPNKWTGIGSDEEVRAASRQFQTSAVLSGTTRMVSGKKRVSLKMVRHNGAEVLGHWQLELEQGAELGHALRQQQIGREVFQRLDVSTETSHYADPSLTNETARSYIQAGRDLLDRRTIADINRAIGCFEGAIATVPNSAHAHAYLAYAYMGRNFLTRDTVYTDRAFAAAFRAIELSPNDAIANRSLASLYNVEGKYAQALEHSFRSLEAAQPTERAFAQVARTLQMLGRPDKAIAWYKKANATQRLPADYEALIGDCWAALNDRLNATAAYEAALRFRPDLPDGWLGLCRLEMLDANFDAARQLFATRAAEYGHFHNSRHLQAQIEFFARNFAVAEELLSALQTSNPESTASQQYGAMSYGSALARAKAEHGDPAAAELLASCRATDEAELMRSPAHPEVLYRYAAVLSMTGETAVALDSLRRAIASGWTDFRSPSLDPRFDRIRDEPEFRRLLEGLRTRIEQLRDSMPDTANYKPGR